MGTGKQAGAGKSFTNSLCSRTLKLCFGEDLEKVFWWNEIYSANIFICVKYEAALKVMPPIYYHGKYNEYKNHKNTV